MLSRNTKSFSSTLLLLLVFFIPFNLLAQKTTTVKHPEWSNNVSIYEVNIRQYTPEGTFKAFQKHLPELKKMGIGILWLMPINPIGEVNRKGSLGSYYSIKDYMAVNPEYGTLKDFKQLVDEAHKLGMKVIIDWVANHSSWDNPIAKTHPEFYKTNSQGKFEPPVADWSDVIALNFNNPKLWVYMENAMEYWIKECDIDGFRCDVAGMVQTPFWNFARKELDKLKPVFMLAEAEGTEFHERAFDMTYAWELHHITKEIYAGRQNVNGLDNYYQKENSSYNKNAYIMVFTSNHDENSWKGSVFERFGSAAKTFAVFSGIVKGMPLIYSGQEAGMNKSLRFFDKDTINWKKSDFRSIYETLNNLKIKNKALWNGEYGGEMQRINTNDNSKIFAFVREKDGNKVFAVFNLSAYKIKIEIKDKTISGNYKLLFSGKKNSFKESYKAELPAWGYEVFVK